MSNLVWLRAICHGVWGLPLLLTVVSVSLYFSFRLRFVQIRGLRRAFQCLRKGGDASGEGDISHFAALCTALSATLGTGNIVGIAVALKLGGPGALFWMIVSSFFSLALKYSEGVLAVKFRTTTSDGTMAGGPMYYLEKGLKSPFLGRIFAIFGAAVALVGIGTMAQTTFIAAAASSFGVPVVGTAVCVGVLTALVIWGEIQRIARTAERIVPFMTLLYLGAAFVLLGMHYDRLWPAIRLIFTSAWSPQAWVGGSVGIVAMMRVGISRGIFCHESGLGSAAIAAAAAKTNRPADQGLVSMAGAFVSVLICCITALVLMTTASETQIWGVCPVEETRLTAYAFGAGLGCSRLGEALVHISIVFFAFTSIIGWNYYGEKCVQYLFKSNKVFGYRILFLFFVVAGPFFKIQPVLIVADIVTGLMAIPNLVGLVALRRIVVAETAKISGKV